MTGSFRSSDLAKKREAATRGSPFEVLKASQNTPIPRYTGEDSETALRESYKATLANR
jgi:hypothetical protein